MTDALEARFHEGAGLTCVCDLLLCQLHRSLPQKLLLREVFSAFCAVGLRYILIRKHGDGPEKIAHFEVVILPSIVENKLVMQMKIYLRRAQ